MSMHHDHASSPLRSAIWSGSTHGDKKLILLRLCDHANDASLAPVCLSQIATDVRLPTTMVRRHLNKLINRGDLQPVHRETWDVRTYRLTPRL